MVPATLKLSGAAAAQSIPAVENREKRAAGSHMLTRGFAATFSSQLVSVYYYPLLSLENLWKKEKKKKFIG